MQDAQCRQSSLQAVCTRLTRRCTGQQGVSEHLADCTWPSCPGLAVWALRELACSLLPLRRASAAQSGSRAARGRLSGLCSWACTCAGCTEALAGDWCCLLLRLVSAGSTRGFLRLAAPASGCNCLLGSGASGSCSMLRLLLPCLLMSCRLTPCLSAASLLGALQAKRQTTQRVPCRLQGLTQQGTVETNDCGHACRPSSLDTQKPSDPVQGRRHLARVSGGRGSARLAGLASSSKEALARRGMGSLWAVSPAERL